MPIRGITDTVQAAFPTIGKLRKGAEATRDKDGKVVRVGADLEYFRFTSERPEVQAAFEAAYGKQPALINAYLPYARVEENFSAWKEKWVAGGLVHRCDGETMTLWLGPDGKHRREPKPCDGGCKEVGRLSLMIPELLQTGLVGYICLETHGIHDLLSIQASLLAASEAREGNPLGLRGIRWVIRRAKEKVSTPLGNGKRGRRDKWLVKIEPAADWVQLQLRNAHNDAMGLLEAPRPHVDAESGEILGEPEPEPDEPEAEADDDADFVPLVESLPDPDGIPEADAAPPTPTGPSEAWKKAEAKLIELSNAQGRTLAKTQESICRSDNCVWGDLTIAQLERWTKQLQESNIKGSAKT